MVCGCMHASHNLLLVDQISAVGYVTLTPYRVSKYLFPFKCDIKRGFNTRLLPNAKLQSERTV